MRLVWTTDCHLNHVPNERRERWLEEIASHGADGVVISGDISEGDDVVSCLRHFAETLALPIYFVLGNHDFYRSSVAATRQQVVHACREDTRLCYLTDQPGLRLADGAYLIGDDGWGDGLVGDYEGSTIRLNDFQLIDDFRTSNASTWKQQLDRLGADCGARLRQKLEALPQDARQALVVTHVPPFREACWYEGYTTDDNWAPFFVCGHVGSVLREASARRPELQLTVLCGHTHHAGVARIADNLIVYTGAADYGEPDVEGIVEVNGEAVEYRPTT